MSIIEAREIRADVHPDASATPSTVTALESATAGFLRANAAYRQAYATWRAEREIRRPGECGTSAADERRDRRFRALFAVHQELDAAAASVRREGGQIDYSPDGGDTVRIYGPSHQLLGHM